jgi:hypothetical protein
MRVVDSKNTTKKARTNKRPHPTQDSKKPPLERDIKPRTNTMRQTSLQETAAVKESGTHRIPIDGRRRRRAQKRKMLAANHRDSTRGRRWLIQRKTWDRRRVSNFAVAAISAASCSGWPDDEFNLFPLSSFLELPSLPFREILSGFFPS